MIGLQEPTAGKVYLNGHDMQDPDEARRAYLNMGVCTQFDSYLPDLTVRDHLRVFAALHGVSWDQVDEVVNNLAMFVHLNDVLDKKVRQLSGGMRRRMNLALALIG